MRERFYSLFAKLLVFIGAVVLFIPILFYLLAWSVGGYVPQLFDILVLAVSITFGVIIVIGGGTIQRVFGEKEPFLVTNGEPIHSGRVWKNATETGLFETLCGLVVSTNDESGATAHVGYRIIPVKRATCNACIQKRGREILDAGASGRGW